MQFRKLWTFALGLSTIVAIISTPTATYPLETHLKKVTVAYTSYAPFLMPFLLEKELGFFREEGLRPEFILVRGGGVAVKGLVAGNFDYIMPGGVVIDPILRARQPLKIILTTSMVHFWLTAQPGVFSIADLRGKSIGSGAIGSDTDHVAREILKRNGLDPFKDVTFLMVGSSRERFAALSSGAVHAALLSPPFNFKAIEMGYRKLASAKDYTSWPQGGLGVRDERIFRDPQEVSKMVRASLKGLKLVLTQEEYVLLKMTEMFRLKREEAEQTYVAMQEGFVASGYLPEEAQRNVISTIKQAANIAEEVPPERVFDYRFVKQAEQELKNWKPQILR